MESEEVYSPAQAARILRLSRRQVTNLLNAGDLEGTQDPENGRWSIPQRAVHERLKDRPARGRPDDQGAGQEAPEAGQEAADLRSRVEDLQYRLGRAEARIELEELTESTRREERERLIADLERERERAERLEAELREARRGFWRRLFGGPG